VRSFDEVFDDLYANAYRVAYRLLGQRADAEDIAQESLARAYVRWPKVEDYAEAWVSRVSVNLALDALRRSQRKARFYHREALEHDPRADERLDLGRALMKLPRRQREVVTLRYLADFSEASVAAELRCSPGAVKQHASRGLAALRRELQSTEGPANYV
jgi:RNA polymerase sigma factor (sigma-70 family)